MNLSTPVAGNAPVISLAAVFEALAPATSNTVSFKNVLDAFEAASDENVLDSGDQKADPHGKALKKEDLLPASDAQAPAPQVSSQVPITVPQIAFLNPHLARLAVEPPLPVQEPAQDSTPPSTEAQADQPVSLQPPAAKSDVTPSPMPAYPEHVVARTAVAPPAIPNNTAVEAPPPAPVQPNAQAPTEDLQVATPQIAAPQPKPTPETPPTPPRPKAAAQSADNVAARKVILAASSAALEPKTNVPPGSSVMEAPDPSLSKSTNPNASSVNISEPMTSAPVQAKTNLTGKPQPAPPPITNHIAAAPAPKLTEVGTAQSEPPKDAHLRTPATLPDTRIAHSSTLHARDAITAPKQTLATAPPLAQASAPKHAEMSLPTATPGPATQAAMPVPLPPVPEAAPTPAAADPIPSVADQTTIAPVAIGASSAQQSGLVESHFTESTQPPAVRTSSAKETGGAKAKPPTATQTAVLNTSNAGATSMTHAVQPQTPEPPPLDNHRAEPQSFGIETSDSHSEPQPVNAPKPSAAPVHAIAQTISASSATAVVTPALQPRTENIAFALRMVAPDVTPANAQHVPAKLSVPLPELPITLSRTVVSQTKATPAPASHAQQTDQPQNRESNSPKRPSLEADQATERVETRTPRQTETGQPNPVHETGSHWSETIAMQPAENIGQSSFELADVGHANQTLAPQELHAIAPELPKAPASTDILLHLTGNDQAAAAIRVADRAGAVNVSVHASDPVLRESLRSNLGELSTQLNQQGWKTEVKPATLAAQSESQQDSHSGGGKPSQEQQHSFGGDRHAQRERRDPGGRWVQELEQQITGGDARPGGKS